MNLKLSLAHRRRKLKHARPGTAARRFALRMVQRRKKQLEPRPVTGVDQAGLAFIAELEGVIPYAYNDSRGFATAWVGHLIAYRPVNATDLKKWGSPQHPAKMADVLAFFKQDLRPYEHTVSAVWAAAPRHPTQHEYNACVSLTFNIGVGGFAKSSAARLIREGADPKAIAGAMLFWNKPPEIQGRRRREHDLFLTR